MDLHKAVRDPWVWGQLVLLAAVALLAPLMPRYVNLGDADFMLNRVGPAWQRGIGVMIVLAGAALAVWGARTLGPSLTPGIEPLPGAPLVVTGPYARMRHPIYAGVVVCLAGYTLAWSNWTLAMIVGFVALQFFEAKARAEERWLVETYPQYRQYMVHVRRRVA
jgi:protein-S-isoprenylcysteine O-methyltransferase Ste14